MCDGANSGRAQPAQLSHGHLFRQDLLWTRMYGAAGDVHIAPHTYLEALIDMGDGYLFTGVSRTGTDDNVLLVRTDGDGLVGCATSDPVVVTTVLTDRPLRYRTSHLSGSA
ncbi:MAG: hypothetical protein IPL52_11515 [Flavobacteriales bacterium]|nr:hypothetical protein [Flavobacteriales bacterium]